MTTPDYNRGYRDGINSRPLEADASPGYADGWLDGESDRPTLDDLTFDLDREMRGDFGY